MTGITPTSVKGTIIKTLDLNDFLSTKDIFRRNFRPHDNWESFSTIMSLCQKEVLIEREYPDRQRPNRYRLTDKGKTVKEALSVRP